MQFSAQIRELAESDAGLAQCDSPRPATRIIAKLRILDSDALCTTVWVKLSLGSRTASGLGCIDALLEQSGHAPVDRFFCDVAAMRLRFGCDAKRVSLC